MLTAAQATAGYTSDLAIWTALAATASLLVALAAVGVPWYERRLNKLAKESQTDKDRATSKRLLLTVVRYFEDLLDPFRETRDGGRNLTTVGLDNIVGRVMDRALYDSVPAEFADKTYAAIFDAYRALTKIADYQARIAESQRAMIETLNREYTKPMMQQQIDARRREAATQHSTTQSGLLNLIQTTAKQAYWDLSRARVSLGDSTSTPPPPTRASETTGPGPDSDDHGPSN